jgi:hypothetical protein
VVLFDIGALGLTSLPPSGLASRVLIVAAILNPVDAVRTGTLLAVEVPPLAPLPSHSCDGATGGRSMLLWRGAVALAGVKLERADIC